MKNCNQLFDFAVAQNATDIHICAGAPAQLRVRGKLKPVTEEKLSPEKSKQICYEMLTDEQIRMFEQNLDFDLMMAYNGSRFRINVGYFNGAVGATVRVLSGEPKTPDELFLPDIVKTLALKDKGLVLITGSTSQGKTTTMAAMIDYVNSIQKKHIITIEDPIEYVHNNKKGIVRQREVGRDTKTFATGLRAALRQDPDIIAIGEMRDYETIKIALTAAETGILVLSTLHVISIDKMIERIISYGPEESENTVRFLLAETLQGVIHQELLPLISGQQRVACEIMIATAAVKSILRRKGGYHLRTAIETGRKFGMCTMAEEIEKMLNEKLISEEIAKLILDNYS
ncbi:MAG: Twitching mobility protein [Planctomycetes bacterium ADurb.Bin401]|nr:MAG: Twitching mobility protein [Planctomycetes bacterium ADurb.Bin401]